MKYTIIGAGPAGLTAAYLLAKKGEKVVVLERDNQVGGISKTVRYGKYRFDIGGHRFFAKIPEINRFWEKMLGREFLNVRRISRIYYQNKFYNYPLEPKNALKNLGTLQALLAVGSYAKSKLRPIKPEKNLADVYINSFGRYLYCKFFHDYSHRLWGMYPDRMEPDWGRQRVGKLSLLGAVKDAFRPNQGGLKSLTKRFKYPKYGPGQMWEKVAERIEKTGGKIRLEAPVEKIYHQGGKIRSLKVLKSLRKQPVDHLISTMALKDLVMSLSPKPPETVLKATEGLKYRDFILVALVVNKRKLFPDQWIYVQDPGFTTLRVQNAGNWSPYLVGDKNKSVLGLEFTALEGDGLWRKDDKQLINLAISEGERLGFLTREKVVDAKVVKQLKAYPVYDLGYAKRVGIIRNYLSRLDNLVTIGRNGMHKYNNMDHSMLTAMQAVENLFGADHDIWQVNVNADYHESTGKEAA
jgi:protoporphyrinogen oxidase